ncbi:uncharacterized protein SOCE836_040230 [Sorangium cellulosum]|uniref:Uncharacterized protein n=1 Tax=Sorangium cellulosum TaxID=56 RepID=A0A4P2QP52_SORCE|nr:uncharacterized protein SOCE836_040230 [Sorangium cellulosum]WCQ91264.1 hypothetical protein NQZ70_03979 [Sorangium sp. Soce836]
MLGPHAPHSFATFPEPLAVAETVGIDAAKERLA